MNTHLQPQLDLSNLDRAFGTAIAPVRKGGVLTLAVGLPMTAQNLAMLEAAWRFADAAPKPRRG